MELTRRGLFKTIFGAAVAAEVAPLLPAAPSPNIAALIQQRMDEGYAEMGRILSEGINPDWNGTFNGGKYIHESFILRRYMRCEST